MGLLDFLKAAAVPAAQARGGFQQGQRASAAAQHELERESMLDQMKREMQQSEISQNNAQIDESRAHGRYWDNLSDSDAVQYIKLADGTYQAVPKKIAREGGANGGTTVGTSTAGNDAKPQGPGPKGPSNAEHRAAPQDPSAPVDANFGGRTGDAEAGRDAATVARPSLMSQLRTAPSAAAPPGPPSAASSGSTMLPPTGSSLLRGAPPAAVPPSQQPQPRQLTIGQPIGPAKTPVPPRIDRNSTEGIHADSIRSENTALARERHPLPSRARDPNAPRPLTLPAKETAARALAKSAVEAAGGDLAGAMERMSRPGEYERAQATGVTMRHYQQAVTEYNAAQERLKKGAGSDAPIAEMLAKYKESPAGASPTRKLAAPASTSTTAAPAPSAKQEITQDQYEYLRTPLEQGGKGLSDVEIRAKYVVKR